MQRVAPLISRVLLAAIFLFAGYGKIVGWEGTAGYMAAKGMPFAPLLLAGALALELLGGFAVLVGFQTKWASFALFAFLIPTTLIFHNFWAVPVEEQQIQLLFFLKNLAIMGGLLNLSASGAGAFSVDNLAARHVGDEAFGGSVHPSR